VSDVKPWFYASDPRFEDGGDGGPFMTREEAVHEGLIACDRQPFYVATGTRVDAADLMPPAEHIIVTLGESFADEFGDFAEDMVDVSREAEAELDELLKAWALKHVHVRWHVVDGTPERIDPAAEASS
jgi:hypothetical protein